MKTKNKKMEFFVGSKKESCGMCFGKIGKKFGRVKEAAESIGLLPSGKYRGEL
jgi:hypothetical protein